MKCAVVGSSPSLPSSPFNGDLPEDFPLSVEGKTNQRFSGTARASDIETPSPPPEFCRRTFQAVSSPLNSLRHWPKSTLLLHCLRGRTVQENTGASTSTVVGLVSIQTPGSPLSALRPPEPVSVAESTRRLPLAVSVRNSTNFGPPQLRFCCRSLAAALRLPSALLGSESPVAAALSSN